MNLMPAAGPQISLENHLRMEEERPKPPKRRNSLLVDYSKTRANGTNPEESRRLSIDNSSRRGSMGNSIRRGSMGNSRRGSMGNSSSRRGSMGNTNARISSGSGFVRRSSNGEGLIQYYTEGRRVDTRQPLNLFEVKKPRRGSSSTSSSAEKSIEKKQRQPSLILEKRSGHRVSTVLELDSDMEDLGDLSESDMAHGNDDGSIHFPELEEDHTRRRYMDEPSSTTEGTSLDDSDVVFTLRRNVTLPARSSTFDATVKSSADRLNESLLFKADDEDEQPLGRRSQLELARALHDSMKQLIVDLEEQEKGLNTSSHGKRSSLTERRSLQAIRRPLKQPEATQSALNSSRPSLTVPDRRTLLAKQNSMSNIINNAVADTVNWLVESADRPIQTLDRASSLRDLFAKQNSFSKPRKQLPSRRYSRSLSSANLAASFNGSFHSKQSALSRSSHQSSKSGPLRRSNSMRYDSSFGSGFRKSSPSSRKGQLKGFRKQSKKNVKDEESSNDTRDFCRQKGDMDSNGSSHQSKSMSKNNRRSKIGRASSASNVYRSSRSSRLSNRMINSKHVLPDLIDTSNRNTYHRSKTTEERSPVRRSSNGLVEDRRRHLKRGYSHSAVVGNSSGRQHFASSRNNSFRTNRRMRDDSANSENNKFVTGSRIRRL